MTKNSRVKAAIKLPSSIRYKRGNLLSKIKIVQLTVTPVLHVLRKWVMLKITERTITKKIIASETFNFIRKMVRKGFIKIGIKIVPLFFLQNIGRTPRYIIEIHSLGQKRVKSGQQSN